MSALFRQWRQAIYSLKREFGIPVSFYNVTSSVNALTGLITETKSHFKIWRGIVLTSEQIRKKVIPQVHNGMALFDLNDRFIVLSKRDVPSNYKLDSTQYLIFNHKRYNMKTIQEIENEEVVIIHCSQLIEPSVYETVSRSLVDSLTPAHSVSYVIE